MSIRENMQANTKGVYKKFVSAPAALKIFAIFALSVTVFQFIIVFFLPGEITSVYFKNFGTSTAGSYGFTLYFVFALIFFNKESKPDILRLGIVSPLLVCICFKYLSHLKAVNDGDAFKNAGITGFVWSIVIPLIWIMLILFSARVNRFCRNILLLRK